MKTFLIAIGISLLIAISGPAYPGGYRESVYVTQEEN